jgi:uncharacterized membrane protein
MTSPSEPGEGDRQDRPDPSPEADERTGRRRSHEFVGSAESESTMAERMTFFSDAVVAIAMTLLALELPVPEGLSAHAFWEAARENSREYFAFLLSFVVIAAYWGSHHRFFRFVRRVDDRLRFLNFCWLFAVVVLPFVTKVVSGPGDWGPGGSSPSRFALYAAVQVLGNGTFALMVFHAQSKRLLRTDAPRLLTITSYWRAATIATGFLVSIPFFFFWDKAWLLWIILPVVLTVTSRAELTRRRKRAPGQS